MSVMFYLILITQTFGTSMLHQYPMLFIGIIYISHLFREWFNVEFSALCIWDSYLHIFLPALLMLVFGYINTKRRFLKEQQTKKELEDMKTVVGQLNSGIALIMNQYSD